jgi:hypothetical protein
MKDPNLLQLKATINLTSKDASIQSEYLLENPERQVATLDFRSIQTGIMELQERKPTDIRKKLTLPLISGAPNLNKLDIKKIKITLDPLEKKVLDIDLNAPVTGTRTKSFMFLPNLDWGQKEIVAQKLSVYDVQMKLPANAKRIVYSSVKPSRTTKTQDGYILSFKQQNVYPIPISIKWTELPEEVTLSKTIRRLTGNNLSITLRIKNVGKEPAFGLMLSDHYPAADVTPTLRENFELKNSRGRDSWWLFEKTMNLAAGETKIFTYTIHSRSVNLSIRPARVTKSNNLIAVSATVNQYLNFTPPPPIPKAAFSLPSGWSFDFLHGGDHHINEHGMWCTGQNYDQRRERLSWSTGCVYADKNFDDDFRWQTAHQVVRFNPGVAIHRSTPWLAKSGSITTVNESFSHSSLKYFTNVVVLLRGWRFDFTSSDHHINRMRLYLDTTSFNKATGTVSWRASVIYADKNFDDMFRFQYHYTILGFNGNKIVMEYNGTDKGGSAVHQGNITNNNLKGFARGMIFPIGWDFDFTSTDHHINEHNFRLQNTNYNSGTGRFTWNAHLQYADKNFDDDYNWKYKVCVIATNDGESADFIGGPFNDDGGFDTKNFMVDLNNLLKPITWTNGVKDGDETGVDSGGSSPAKYMNCLLGSINPGNATDSGYFSLKNSSELMVVKAFATVALMEYAQNQGQNFNTFYSGVEKADRYVEAIAYYVNEHMEWVKDGGSWSGKQSAIRTLTESAHRGSKDFHGDCEDHAILRAALLRSLGFNHRCIFCADHHNSVDQGQNEECGGDKKKSGGHTYNIVVYKGKYRIMDYGKMEPRYWNSGGNTCWDQHVTDNIWNDHTGEHWDKKDTSPYGGQPLVNYPGNPSSPSSNWDWRTYYNDITP